MDKPYQKVQKPKNKKEIMTLIMGRIEEQARNKKIRKKDIALRLKVNSSMVTHYFKLSSHIPFSKFVELLIMVYDKPEDRLPFINEYVKVTNKMDNLKEIVEWYLVNGSVSEIEKIGCLLKNDQHFLSVVNLIILRNTRKIKKMDFYKHVQKNKDLYYSGYETKILWQIAYLYSLLDFNSYRLLEYHAAELLEMINDEGNSFLKKAFYLRVKEMLAISYLRQNRVKEARDICFNVISETDSDLFPVPISSFYNLLSESYAFTDINEAQSYNKQAFMIYEKCINENINRRLILESTHDFIKIHNGDFKNLFLSDPSEKAHYLAKIPGKEIDALNLLFEIEKYRESLSPFQIYYKALALKDTKLLEKSEEGFVLEGNAYYSRLPKTAKFK